MEGEGEVEEEREEEVCYCLEGCCKDESFSAAWDRSGLCVVHDSELRVSQPDPASLAAGNHLPHSFWAANLTRTCLYCPKELWSLGIGFQIRLNCVLPSFLKALLCLWFCPPHLYLDGKGIHQFIGQFLAISVSDYCTLSQSLIKLPLWKLAEFITCIWDQPILSL